MFGNCSKSGPICSAFRALSCCESVKYLSQGPMARCLGFRAAIELKIKTTPDICKETETMYRFLGRSMLIAALVISTGVAVFAQKEKSKDKSLTCNENSWYNDRLVGNCEIREQTLAPSGGTIALDGRDRKSTRLKSS